MLKFVRLKHEVAFGELAYPLFRDMWLSAHLTALYNPNRVVCFAILSKVVWCRANIPVAIASIAAGSPKPAMPHLRGVIVEAAWAYRHKPWVGGALLKHQRGLDQAVKDIAWKAQWRLTTRYRKLSARGKNKPQVITALGRELLGFVWAIAVRIETQRQLATC